MTVSNLREFEQVEIPVTSKPATAAAYCEDAIKRLDGVVMMGGTSYDSLRLVMLALADLHRARKILVEQVPLPGLEGTIKRKDRGTLEEVVKYCSELPEPISATDAQWFFFKMQGTGWRNGGQPVASWRMTIRAWQNAKHFPSQKVAVNNWASRRPESIPMDHSAVAIQVINKQLDAGKL